LVDTVDINLVGVINTVHAAYPALRSGASIIAVGSLVALRPRRAYDEAGPGSAGYKCARPSPSTSTSWPRPSLRT
jgi:NAD(P)-dependent dehydrogenase (short-subunit alcohol dehydrogenase family)